MSDVTSPGSAVPLVHPTDGTVTLDWYQYLEALGGDNALDADRLTDLETIVDSTTVTINGTVRPTAAQIWFTSDATPPTGAIQPGDFWQRQDTGELRILRAGVWETVTSDDVRHLGGRPVTVVLADLNLALTNASNSVNDGVLTPGEKVGIIPLINQLRDGRATLAARAVALNVTAALADYSAAMNALDAVLATLVAPVSWSSMAGNTTIADPADFIAKVTTAGRRTFELQAACDGEAARRSDWALVVGRPNTLAELDTAASLLLNATNADGIITRAEVVAARGGDASLSARLTTINGAWSAGDAVLSGQITAVSATVQGRPNLVPNSTFEDGSRGWAGSGGVIIVPAQLTTGWSALVSGWGAGYRELRSPRFAVTSGQSYTLSGRTAARHASIALPLELRLRWLDASGAAVSFSAGRVVADSASMAAVTPLTVTAPALAAQAEVVIVGQDITVPVGAPFAYVYPQRIKVELGGVASMWTDEGQAVATTARVQELVLAEADLDGRVSATWGVYLSAGGQIAGFRAHANGVTSSLDFDAAAFRIFNGATGVPPFEVTGGVVYIQTARIRNLTADNIVAGALTSGWGQEITGALNLTEAWQSVVSQTVTSIASGTMLKTDWAVEVEPTTGFIPAVPTIETRLLINGVVDQVFALVTASSFYSPGLGSLGRFSPQSFSGVDLILNPASADYTFDLQARLINMGTYSGAAASLKNRRIFAQQFRR